MNRRRSERAYFSLNAEFISEGKTYSGSIENVSAEGVEYLMTSFVKASGGFKPQKNVQIHFKTPSGDSVDLNCNVKWFTKTAADEKILLVGMEVIDPPPGYKKFLKNINA